MVEYATTTRRRVEYATTDLALTQHRGTFYGLARSRGFSERDCELAARSGLLARIIACPVVEERGAVLSGAVALARVRELQGRLQDAQLRGGRADLMGQGVNVTRSVPPSAGVGIEGLGFHDGPGLRPVDGPAPGWLSPPPGPVSAS